MTLTSEGTVAKALCQWPSLHGHRYTEVEFNILRSVGKALGLTPSVIEPGSDCLVTTGGGLAVPDAFPWKHSRKEPIRATDVQPPCQSNCRHSLSLRLTLTILAVSTQHYPSQWSFSSSAIQELALRLTLLRRPLNSSWRFEAGETHPVCTRVSSACPVPFGCFFSGNKMDVFELFDLQTPSILPSCQRTTAMYRTGIA